MRRLSGREEVIILHLVLLEGCEILGLWVLRLWLIRMVHGGIELWMLLRVGGLLHLLLLILVLHAELF